MHHVNMALKGFIWDPQSATKYAERHQSLGRLMNKSQSGYRAAFRICFLSCNKKYGKENLKVIRLDPELMENCPEKHINVHKKRKYDEMCALL